MRSCSFSEAGVVVTVRFGLMMGAELGIEAVWKRPMSPQAASDAAARSSTGAAQRRRLIPILRCPASQSTSATLQIRRCAQPRSSFCPGMTFLRKPKPIFPDHARLVPAQNFDLPCSHHLDPRTGVGLDIATNSNSPVFQ
jgi:hypothetical protein